MPLLAYLDSTVKGTTQTGKTPVIALNHHAAPDDPNQVFVIRKKLDASTPDFNAMMTNNTVFDKWKLDLWHNPRSGPECNYLTISLKDAKIAWINLVMPDAQTPEFLNAHEYEDIAFTFSSSTYVKKQEG